MRIVWQNIIFALAVKATVLAAGAFGYANMWLAIFAPFFFLSFNGVSLPVFSIGPISFELWHVALAGILLELFSGILTFFTPHRSTLHDLSTFTRVVERGGLETYLLKYDEEGK